jgi:hypothetical protein
MMCDIMNPDISSVEFPGCYNACLPGRGFKHRDRVLAESTTPGSSSDELRPGLLFIFKTCFN